MTSDIYQTPQADLGLAPETTAQFYVVSRTKFALLYLATMGIYEIYWFYRHWRQYRDYQQRPLWPVPRAIFSVFFAYPLFRLIHDQGRLSGDERRWSPGGFAAIYIVFYLLANFSEFSDRLGVIDVIITGIAFGSMFVLLWLLWRVQDYANLAAGDPGGESNSRLTAANLGWMFFGLLLWLVAIFGLLVTTGIVDVSQF